MNIEQPMIMRCGRAKYVPIKIGETFGHLTVIDKSTDALDGRSTYYNCKCVCGNVKAIKVSRLRDGSNTSCGCVYLRHISSDFTGQRFGRLVVISKIGRSSDGHFRYLAKCDCGRVTKPTSHHLKSGESKSCGCLAGDLSGIRLRTHGRSLTSEFSTWHNMLDRCRNQNSKAYRYYGGRGIAVCNAWSNSFEAFIADMGDKPSPIHSIDRIDVNGDYAPLNCRWANAADQARNRRGQIGQYHIIYPGAFTTTRSLFKYLIESLGVDEVTAILATYRREFSNINLYTYCQDNVANFNTMACKLYLQETNGVHLIEDLKCINI